MIERPGTISIWGPMGIGKSRLALEAARRVPDERSSFWVDLHRARDLEGALHTISVALALPHDDTAARAISAALSSRPLALLVLDGVDGVHDELVELVRQWARDAPDATIMVT